MQTEDIQKLQLVPLQKPFISSKHLHEKLVQPENELVRQSQPTHINIDSSATIATDEVEHHAHPQPSYAPQSAKDDIIQPESIADRVADDSEALIKSPTDNVSSKITKKDLKRTKRLEKKQLKQQKKQQKKLIKKIKSQKTNNSKTKPTDDKNNAVNNNTIPETSPTIETIQTNLNNPNVPRAKSKSPVNVKFSFDHIENDNEAKQSDNSQSVTVHSHNDAAIRRNSNGNYDSLPLVNVERSADDVIDSDFAVESTAPQKFDNNGNVLAANTALPTCSSTDSISFIEDCPHPRRATSIPIETHKNLHDGRFITLQPRNIGAQSMIYARKLKKPLPNALKMPTKRDQFDKTVQILYQSLKESIDHHFERVAYVNNKLCQVCHEFLLVTDAVKCLTCGLVCHYSCTLPQVR